MEPISIGGQQFIKTQKGWIDKKSKAPAGDQLSKILDAARDQVVPNDSVNTSEDKSKNLQELTEILSSFLGGIQGTSSNIEGNQGKADTITPKSVPKKGIKTSLFGKVGETSSGFFRQVLSTASPLVGRATLTAADKVKENIKEKRSKKTVDNTDKILTVLEKINKKLKETSPVQDNKKPITSPSSSNNTNLNPKPQPVKGKGNLLSALGSNVKSTIVGERDKETGEIVKAGVFRDVIDSASPIIGRSILNARDEVIKAKKYKTSPVEDLISRESNKFKEKVDNLSNETQPKASALIEQRDAGSIPNSIKQDAGGPAESNFEKTSEALVRPIEKPEGPVSAIITDIAEGALNKLKDALSNQQTTTTPEKQESKPSLIGELTSGAMGLAATGLGKIRGALGIRPSIKGLRENSAGKVIDAKGKFVSAEKAEAFKLAKERAAAGIGKTVAKEAGEKIGIKGAGKLAGKTLLKKIPLVGLGAGLVFGAGRLMKGDFAGAGLEVASGAASTLPGLGTAASVAIDAGLAARDAGAFDNKESPTIKKVDTPKSTTVNLSNTSKEVSQMKQRAAVVKPQPSQNISTQNSTVVNNNTKQNMMGVPTIPDRGSLGRIKY